MLLSEIPIICPGACREFSVRTIHQMAPAFLYLPLLTVDVSNTVVFAL